MDWFITAQWAPVSGLGVLFLLGIFISPWVVGQFGAWAVCVGLLRRPINVYFRDFFLPLIFLAGVPLVIKLFWSTQTDIRGLLIPILVYSFVVSLIVYFLAEIVFRTGRD